ncbi:MAG: DUF6323 family protein [Porcipelethomonas sp.]
MEFELFFCHSLHSNTDADVKACILNTNEKSMKYGLVLSDSDAGMLVQAGREAIEAYDRIEFGSSVTVKIIEKFMHSSYICQEGYAEIIAGLTDIFYDVKEESMDMLTDEEVINIMYDFFEHESGGDIELLRSRDLEWLCRKIRNAANGIYDY